MSYRLVPCLIVALLAVAPAQTFGLTTITDYNVNFQGPVPATGWKYQWNSGGVIGNNANYTNLLFAAADNRYDSNGLQGLPDPDPAAFVLLNSTRAHPGRGSTQAGGLDRYAIAAYTVQAGQQGSLVLTNAFAHKPSTANGNTDVEVYVNNTLIRKFDSFPAGVVAPLNMQLGNVNVGDTIYVAVGPDGSDSDDSSNLDFTVAGVGNQTKKVADYRDNFTTGTFPTGWKYQWNSGGVIGNNANYTNLLAAGSDYDVDGIPGRPGPDPGAFVFLSSTGGHPGRGSAQAGGLDRYAIASFTVTESGDYAITDSFVNSIDLAGNGGDVFIHVNSGGVLGRYFFTANGQNFNFDTFLGALNAGDTIFVGIGPNGADGNDSFAFDFSVTQIFSIPEPASLSLLALAAGALGVRRRSRV